jgi:hypothetical protein
MGVSYLTDAPSDLSVPSPFKRPEEDPLGLSVLEPGILDLIAPLNDLLDSLVSALLNEGYDCRLSISGFANELCDAPPLGVLVPDSPFEF